MPKRLWHPHATLSETDSLTLRLSPSDMYSVVVVCPPPNFPGCVCPGPLVYVVANLFSAFVYTQCWVTVDWGYGQQEVFPWVALKKIDAPSADDIAGLDNQEEFGFGARDGGGAMDFLRRQKELLDDTTTATTDIQQEALELTSKIPAVLWATFSKKEQKKMTESVVIKYVVAKKLKYEGRTEVNLFKETLPLVKVVAEAGDWCQTTGIMKRVSGMYLFERGGFFIAACVVLLALHFASS